MFFFEKPRLAQFLLLGFIKVFWASLFPWNTVIGDCFAKNLFVKWSSHFSRFSCVYMLRFTSEHDVNGIGNTLEIFLKLGIGFFKIKKNQKSWFCAFRSSHFHSCYFVLTLQHWNISNQFFNNDLLVLIQIEISWP